MAWHPALDDVEANAYEADIRARRSRWRDDREPSTRRLALGGRGCWCGEVLNHDWPRKASGAPHPRPGTEARHRPGGGVTQREAADVKNGALPGAAERSRAEHAQATRPAP